MCQAKWQKLICVISFHPPRNLILIPISQGGTKAIREVKYHTQGHRLWLVAKQGLELGFA